MEKSYVASLSGHQEKRVQINAFLKTFFALRADILFTPFFKPQFFRFACLCIHWTVLPLAYV